jgi:ubiquinone/menaquinone biosynthesis C-methylase UbiE
MGRIRPLYRRDEWACVDRFLEYPWVLKNSLPNNANKPLRILEVGCGWSLLYAELIRRGYETYALDIDDVPMAARYPKLSFWKADATKMPFEDSTFDEVVAVSSIEHMGMRGRHGCMEEIGRILKEGGLALITMPIGKEGVHLEKDEISPAEAGELIASSKLTPLKEEYWKRGEKRWEQVSKEEAESLYNISEKFRLNPVSVCLALEKISPERHD